MAKAGIRLQPLSPTVMSRHVKTLPNTKAKQVFFLLTREDGNSVPTFSGLSPANVSPLKAALPFREILNSSFATVFFLIFFYFFYKTA